MQEQSQYKKSLIRLATIPSTNEFAKELLAKIKPIEGTAIVAEEQTAGKGQIGNKWQSEAGKNLSLSVIYYPRYLSAQRQFQLSKAVALAVYESLVAVAPLPDFRIKWPNDIMADGKKVAGILIENSLEGSRLSESIVGIGINVNQEKFSDLPGAGSLIKVCGRSFELDHILNLLLEKLEEKYRLLQKIGDRTLDYEYLKVLYRKDEYHPYMVDGEIIEGMIIGVDEIGRLALQVGDGLRYYMNKEISYL